MVLIENAVLRKKLSRRESDICARLKYARELIGITQEACAHQLGIQRGRLANYESGRTPLKHEIGLRFCHQIIVNEEWLATGVMPSMKAAAIKLGIDIGTGEALRTIFLRQSMDLLTEPVCRTLPPGELFSVVFDKFLASKYAALAEAFFFVPRIIYSENDPASRNANIMLAYSERWLKLLANEALGLHKSPTEVQTSFTKVLVEIGGQVFRKYREIKLDSAKLESALLR
jgi:transcriptional regulator with XRE-family HTH domain